MENSPSVPFEKYFRKYFDLRSNSCFRRSFSSDLAASDGSDQSFIDEVRCAHASLRRCVDSCHPNYLFHCIDLYDHSSKIREACFPGRTVEALPKLQYLFKEEPMARYGKAAGTSVKSVMRRKKLGTLRSGKGGKGGKVKSRKQTIAIKLSEARKKGAKVPRNG
jgi:Family of unknown function (DUF6496)